MDSVGQILKKNRKLKKLTILNVSKELKISSDILTNIENDFIQNDINIVFLIGHLRSYCDFLHLDQKELINQFKNEHLPPDKINLEIKRPIQDKNFLYSNKIISLSLIIIIFTSFYFLFIEVDKPERDYALIPDLPENYISTVERANLDSFTDNNIKKNEEINFAKVDNKISSSSAIASLPKNEDYNSKITLKFLNDTWLQLRDENDEIVLSQLMNKNDEYSYDLDLNYSITSGNAGHIMVIIDQKVRGKIGKKGQVVDSLVLKKDFSN